MTTNSDASDRTSMLSLFLAALIFVLLGQTALQPGSDSAGAAVTAPSGEEVDTQQPPTLVRVLPVKCTGTGQTMPSKPGPCIVGQWKANRPAVIVWGDSHAWQQVPGIRAGAAGRNVNIVIYVMGSCPPVDYRKVTTGYAACRQQAKEALALVQVLAKRDQPLRVVLGAFWHWYPTLLNAKDTSTPVDAMRLEQARMFAQGITPLFKTLGRLRVQTAVIGQVPFVPAGVPACAAGENPYLCDLPRSVALPAEGPVKSWVLTQMRYLAGNPRYVDTTSYFCDATTCRGITDGQSTWMDDLHLNPAITDGLAPYYSTMVTNMRRR